MSRLNVESDVWDKVHLISKLSKLESPLVIGALTMIWNKSQVLEMTHCSYEELFIFSELKSEKKFQKIFENGKKPQIKFFTEISKNNFEICGNEKQIKSIRSYKERGKKGGEKKRDLAELQAELQAGSKLKQSPTSNNTIQYNTSNNIYPPIIDESLEVGEVEGGDLEKTLSDLVAYAEHKFGVTATKPQIKKFKDQARDLDPSELRNYIDYIASHPKASAETKSISRAFHAAEVSLAMSKWDNRLRIEIRRALGDGAKPSEVSDLIVSHNPKYDRNKLAKYVQKIISTIEP